MGGLVVYYRVLRFVDFSIHTTRLVLGLELCIVTDAG